MSAIAPDWCRRFLKIPYLDRGRTRDGVDCYGLVMLVNREQFGRLVPDYVYASSKDQGAVSKTIGNSFRAIGVRSTSPSRAIW